MERPGLRIAIYLVGGGLLLSWVAPQGGLTRVVAILALIVLCAYLDAFFFGRRKRDLSSDKVVSLGSFRAQRNRRPNQPDGGRERRVLQPVFNSSYLGEAESLTQILRAEGVRPLMVTQSPIGEKGSPHFKVMVPEAELGRAKPIVDLFLARSTKKPS